MTSDDLIFDYTFTIRPLTDEEGGGYFIEFPDLPGCISDGETVNEAIVNGKDAVNCWLAAAIEAGRSIPEPSAVRKLSGRWVQRAPKSLHKQLAQRAQHDGVSLNTLVITLLSAALGAQQKERYK